VTLVPDAGDADHLATVRPAGPHAATDDDRALAEAIARRHTVRAPFLSRTVPDELVDRLQVESEAHGTWIKRISESEEEVATVFLIDRAEEMERNDPAYLEELQRWLRTDPAAVDGVPVEAVPSEDPHGRPSNWLIRDFVVADREARAPFRPAGDPEAAPPEVERPTVLLMGTENDDRHAWLQSGRALGRLLLRVTAEGLAASPLTQALDWPATRARLSSRLSLIGHPQMLLRMGYPSDEGSAVTSGRRPVEQVLSYRAG
jgi:nitroreductase